MKFTLITISGMVLTAKAAKREHKAKRLSALIEKLPVEELTEIPEIGMRMQHIPLNDLQELDQNPKKKSRELTHTSQNLDPGTCCSDDGCSTCTTFALDQDYCVQYLSGTHFKKSATECLPFGTCFDNADCTSSYGYSTQEHCFTTHSKPSWKQLGGTTCIVNCNAEPTNAQCLGDPHFITWFKKELFDFHGSCDVIAIMNKSFGKSLGLELHLRLTQVFQYSYIEEAALKIGNDTFWVRSLGDFSINGIRGQSSNTTQASFAGYDFSHWHAEKDYFHVFHFYFSATGEKLEIKAFENMLYITADNGKEKIFEDSIGIMGEGKTGNMVGRDGTSIIQDPWEFGSEWQVRNTDSNLFPTGRYPQWPDKCIKPSAPTNRLVHPSVDKKIINQDEAEEHCASWDMDEKSSCIYDVMATGNIEIAKMKIVEAEVLEDMAAAVTAAAAAAGMMAETTNSHVRSTK